MTDNTTISFMALSRTFTIQVRVIYDCLKAVFSTILVDTGQLLGIAKRTRGPSDNLRCFYRSCSFRCPSMKSMTNHIARHYNGLRPSVNKKKATRVPSLSPRLQCSPSAVSIHNEPLTPPNPSPRLPLRSRESPFGRLGARFLTPSISMSLSPRLSA